jgi:hypothetical protein
MTLREHLPIEVLRNPSASAFVDTLDAVLVGKRGHIEEFVRSFNPITVSKTAWLKKYLADLGNLPTYISMNKHVLEGLVLHAYDIYKYKGTVQGVCLFLEIVSEGICSIDASDLIKLPNYIQLTDFDYGFLELSSEDDEPQTLEDKESYDAEILGDPPPHGIRFLFLFEDNLNDMDNSITITVQTVYYQDQAFRAYLEAVLPTMLPAFGGNTTLILNLTL